MDDDTPKKRISGSRRRRRLENDLLLGHHLVQKWKTDKEPGFIATKPKPNPFCNWLLDLNDCDYHQTTRSTSSREFPLSRQDRQALKMFKTDYHKPLICIFEKVIIDFLSGSPEMERDDLVESLVTLSYPLDPNATYLDLCISDPLMRKLFHIMAK